MQGPSRTATGYPAPPPGSAYTYAAPPPYSQPQYNDPNPPPFYATRSFIRAFLATIIILSVIFGAIILITWLVLRPRLPHFEVDSLSLVDFYANPQSVSGTWHIGFVVRNGNKKLSVTYNTVRSSVFYESTYLSGALLPPFQQGAKSETILNATFSAVDAYVDRWVVDHINREWARGIVVFDVQLVAYASFRSGSWRFRTREVNVLCPKVPVGIPWDSTSGKLAGGARGCKVWA